MRTSLALLFISAVVLFSSCEKLETLPANVMAMKPLYTDGDDASLIKAEDPRPFGTLGAISERGSYLYIIERYKGIHVIDNSDPNNPINIAFWNIPGCVALTLSGDRLYVQNTKNLWVIKVVDVKEIQVIDKEEDVFSTTVGDAVRPPASYRERFECVDPSKGIVVGWERQLIEMPLCKTI